MQVAAAIAGRFPPGENEACLHASHTCLHAKALCLYGAYVGACEQLSHGLVYNKLMVDLQVSSFRCCHPCVPLCVLAGAAIAVALPLTVEAVVIYLAIILAGCVVVSIADSFAAHEVDTRLRISGAAAMFTQAGFGVYRLACVERKNAAAVCSLLPSQVRNSWLPVVQS